MAGEMEAEGGYASASDEACEVEGEGPDAVQIVGRVFFVFAFCYASSGGWKWGPTITAGRREASPEYRSGTGYGKNVVKAAAITFWAVCSTKIQLMTL